MSPKFVFAIAGAFIPAAALLPASAMAQSDTVDEKSPDQIACELSDSCVDSESSDAAAQDSAPATRSWSWGSRPTGQTAAPTSSAGRPAASTRPKGAGLASASGAKAAGARVPGRGLTRLAISFANGSDQLTDAGIKQADQLFRAISSASLSGSHYLISGHTDVLGAPADNLDLSRRRAQVLVNYLVGKGLARDQFRVRGYGSERLLPGVPAASQANRRVEVIKLD